MIRHSYHLGFLVFTDWCSLVYLVFISFLFRSFSRKLCSIKIIRKNPRKFRYIAFFQSSGSLKKTSVMKRPRNIFFSSFILDCYLIVFLIFAEISEMLKKNRLEKLFPVKWSAWLYASALQNFTRRHFFYLNGVSIVITWERDFETGENMWKVLTKARA